MLEGETVKKKKEKATSRQMRRDVLGGNGGKSDMTAENPEVCTPSLDQNRKALEGGPFGFPGGDLGGGAARASGGVLSDCCGSLLTSIEAKETGGV